MTTSLSIQQNWAMSVTQIQGQLMELRSDNILNKAGYISVCMLDSKQGSLTTPLDTDVICESSGYKR